MSKKLSLRLVKRHFLRNLSLLAAFAVPFVAGCQKNDPRDAVIAGGSMAPILVGEHYRAACQDCGFLFDADLKIPKQGAFVCPNCAFAEVIPPQTTSPSDQVQILDKSVFNRWDIVAFKRKQDEFASVKRIVGLPGERVNIEGGDVFVDSKRIQKPFELQRQLQIPVFDSYFSPQQGVPNRWRANEESSRWSPNSTGYEFEPDAARTDFDWLTYHHWRGFHHLGRRIEDFPIEDSYAFNQAISRTLVPVSDLHLAVEIASAVGDGFAIRLNHQQAIYEFQIFPATNTLIVKTTAGAEWQVGLSKVSDAASKLELTTFDATLRLIVNGEQIFETPLTERVTYKEPVRYALSIGARNGSLRIRRIRIYRDIYYRALDNQPREGYLLGDDEYYLLGDNVAVSVDSRHWEKYGVKKTEILGKLAPISSNDKLD